MNFQVRDAQITLNYLPLFMKLLLKVSTAERLASLCLIQKTSVLGEQVILHLPWWSQAFNSSKWLTEKTSPCKYFKTEQKTTQTNCREIPMFCFFVLKTKHLSESWMRKTHFTNTASWFFVGFPEAFKGDIAETRWLIWAAENDRLFVAKTRGTMVIFHVAGWGWI